METIELICKVCGKKFLKNAFYINWQRKNINTRIGSFCSDACFRVSRRRPEAYETRTCAYCNNPFQFLKSKLNSSSNMGKYCSKECFDAEWTKRKGSHAVKCGKCGKIFLAYNSQHDKYCSPECAGVAPVERFEYHCLICGKTFLDLKSRNRKCCSHECQCKYVANLLRKDPDDNKRRCSRKSWRMVRLAIIERDGGICTHCGSDNDLIVHHVISWKQCRKDEPNNLITLCRRCHAIIESKEFLII